MITTSNGIAGAGGIDALLNTVLQVGQKKRCFFVQHDTRGQGILLAKVSSNESRASFRDVSNNMKLERLPKGEEGCISGLIEEQTECS